LHLLAFLTLGEHDFVSRLFGVRGMDRRRSPRCRTARREAVQRDREGFEDLCDCALASAPDLNLSDNVIRWLRKQHGGCTTLPNHHRRSTALRAWGIITHVAIGDQCRFNDWQQPGFTGIAHEL